MPSMTPRPILDAVPDPGEEERAVRRAAAAEKAKELGLAWPAWSAQPRGMVAA